MKSIPVKVVLWEIDSDKNQIMVSLQPPITTSKKGKKTIMTSTEFINKFYHPKHPLIASRIRRNYIFEHTFTEKQQWGMYQHTWGAWILKE